MINLVTNYQENLGLLGFEAVQQVLCL